MTAIGMGISIFTGSRKTAAGPASAPVNVSLPEITGEARVGVQLLCSQGEWDASPSPTFAYQWKSDGANVGTNANTYTPVPGDVANVITCAVTATNASGNATATSLGTLPVLGTTVTIAQRLLGDEPNGIAIGFQDDSCLIRDTVTPANNYEATIFSKLTFARASTGTFFNSLGLMGTAPVDVPRIQHHPIDNATMGLLIEAAATNLYLQSAHFDDAVWGKVDCTVTPNAAVDPTGANGMFKLINDIGAYGWLEQSANFTSGTVYTISAFLRAGEITKVKINMDLAIFADGSYRIAEYDMLTGQTRIVTGSDVTAKLIDLGGGLWLASMTFTPTISAAAVCYIYDDDVAGDGISGWYLWGVQLEAGAALSSYIDTLTTTVTRAADNCSFATSSINFSQTAGTIITQPSPLLPELTSTRYLAGISNGASSNYIAHVLNNNVPQLQVVDAGISQALISSGGTQDSQVASAWTANDMAISAVGNPAILDTVGTIPGISNLIVLGNRVLSNPSALKGSLSKFMHLPRRVTNAELEALSVPFV
jgi:hypothetical protein